MNLNFRVLKDFVLDTYDFEQLLKDGLIKEIKPEGKMKPKKWSVEWAMKRYGVVKKGTHYYCGDRYIFVTSGAKNTFWLGEPGNINILKEKAAVKWLVADQPRVEKKRKWVLEKELDIELVGFVCKTSIDLPEEYEKFEITRDNNNNIHIKVYKRSTPSEKAEK